MAPEVGDFTQSIAERADFRVKYDGPITIAFGRNRKDKSFKNKESMFSEFLEMISTPFRSPETYAEYMRLPKTQQDELKDTKCYVGGPLKGGRRKADAVSWRHIITLDADFVKGDLWSMVEMFFDFAVAMHSTRKHCPEKPRLRLIVPLSRPVTPDEYQAVARRVAADLGIDQFDDTTFDVNRLFYLPTASTDAEFVYEFQDAPWLDPDEVLARYEDWRDPSYWPESSRAQQARRKLADKQGDPLEKPGIVGAFCRTYTITAAIETFLSDKYESAGDNRYTYTGGSTAGGLVIYDNDTFAFSHHGTDPISGKLVNAFDLVRLHKFGELDEHVDEGTRVDHLPSYRAMAEFVELDKLVAETRKHERLQAIEEDFGGQDVDPKRLFFDEKRFIAPYMGEWFLHGHHVFVMNNELFVYKDGVYIPGERIFQHEATAAIGTEFQTKRLSEALAYIKNTVPVVTTAQVTMDSQYLNLKNGLLNLETFELKPHTPEFLSVTQLPVEYDPNASCPAIDEFLRRVAPGDCLELIEEMIGYCLTPSMEYEKAFLFHGEGGNGKGTLIELLSRFVGVQNTAQVSLQDLSENRFATSRLFGKMLNLHADIPSKVIENSSQFKELVSGDQIQAEEKHKASFSFKNRAKLIFSANELPASKDNTYGFHRRWIIIPFPNRFNDRKLRSALFTPQELSGLLLRALRGLERLREQDGFSSPKTVEMTLASYREKSDSVFHFLNNSEHCELAENATVSKKDLYAAYRAACLAEGMQPVSQIRFNARLATTFPSVTECREGTQRKWRGLRLVMDEFMD